ncbi:MAG TPA: hypothetical protein VHB25_02450 [Gemmatimonadaceae bacterium]|nr:hypothetical protein [Gemmatimonadaceae bacterium]
MTSIVLPVTRRWFERPVTTRMAILVVCGAVCVLYALWRHTVPPGTVATDSQPDTMCVIARIGLGGFCR